MATRKASDVGGAGVKGGGHLLGEAFGPSGPPPERDESIRLKEPKATTHYVSRLLLVPLCPITQSSVSGSGVL